MSDHERVVDTLEKIFESYAGSPKRRKEKKPTSSKRAKQEKRFIEDDLSELNLSDIERSWKSTRRKLRERDESIRELRVRVEDMEDSKRKKKVLRKWADKSHLKLKPSEVKEEHSDSHRGLWRLHDLLFDRIAHELSSLERRVHRVVQDATNSWDDREKQISFLHSLPLDAPSVIDPKSPRGGGEDDDEFSDDDDDDTFATNSEMMGDDDSYSNISVSTYE